MNRVMATLAICGILTVTAAFAVRVMPEPLKEKETAAAVKSNAGYVSELICDSACAQSHDVKTETKSAEKSESKDEKTEKEPAKTQNPAQTPKPTEKVSTVKKTDTKKSNKETKKREAFFIANAPYDTVKKVEFTTLININNRLDKDYVPDDLVKVADYADTKLVTLNSFNTYANKTALSAFNEMMQSAAQDGVINFYLRNVYRSYDSQEGLWNMRVRSDRRYGRRKGTPLGSAYPGSSEHQTGLAFDITCTASTAASTAFMKTENYRWLRDNSYKFGFILRYAADKTDMTGIKFEPYHYRYVGKELAEELYENGLCLEEYYDMPIEWE